MSLLGAANGLMHDVNDSSGDSDLPAGYTFFAQFVDHDITLDTLSALHQGPDAEKNQLDNLANLRTASLDLDCVYGFGPEASPHLYDSSQPGRLLTGNDENPEDLARTKDGTALIGDPRNDENLYVSQMQLMWINFHNKRLIGRNFEEAQKDVRYHYQYIVLNDFLRRICDEDVYYFARDKMHHQQIPLTPIMDPHAGLLMPLEFSVAAYRFGHTTVRNVYPANTGQPVVELFDGAFGTEGFSAVPPHLVIDWKYLLDINPCHEFVKTKAFDSLLPDELIRMPDPIVGKFASDNDRSLAFRNLLRGYALGLPSGQDVADALQSLGYPVNAKPDITQVQNFDCLPADVKSKLTQHTPLFFYLMVEAEQLGDGKKLGPAASAILMEVFGTMLSKCKTSFLKDPTWHPDPCVAKEDPSNKWKYDPLTLADIARYVQG